jgi:hypothetical protein
MSAYWPLTVALLGCPSAPEPELRLDGEPRVRVESLGPIPVSPRAVLATGEEAAGVEWRVEPGSVAGIVDGRFVAHGPGTARVTGRWRSQEIEWVLDVQPASVLRFDRHPTTVAVGASVPVLVSRFVGDQRVETGAVKWTSSALQIARVDASGQVTGVAPGVAFITAAAFGMEATLEIEVVKAP